MSEKKYTLGQVRNIIKNKGFSVENTNILVEAVQRDLIDRLRSNLLKIDSNVERDPGSTLEKENQNIGKRYMIRQILIMAGTNGEMFE